MQGLFILKVGIVKICKWKLVANLMVAFTDSVKYDIFVFFP